MNIYDISAEYQHLLDNSFDQETGEFHQDLLDKLDDLMCGFEQAMDIKARYVKNMEIMADNLHKEVIKLDDREHQMRSKISKIKQNMKECMARVNTNKISSLCFDISIKKNPAALNIVNESLITDEFIDTTIVTKINKQKIKNAIAQGREIEGAEIVQQTRIDISTSRSGK